MNIGFIGFGTMGQPMTEHLLKAGHSLRVWSRRAASADFATALGAVRCESVQDVAVGSEIVCTNVTGSADVDGLATELRSGLAPQRGIGLLVGVQDQRRLPEEFVEFITEHLGAQAVGLHQPAMVGEQDADRRVLEDRVEFENGLFRRLRHRSTAPQSAARPVATSSTRSSEDVSCVPRPCAIRALSCCQTDAAIGSGAPMRAASSISSA